MFHNVEDVDAPPYTVELLAREDGLADLLGGGVDHAGQHVLGDIQRQVVGGEELLKIIKETLNK